MALRLDSANPNFSKSIPLRSRCSADPIATRAEALMSPVGSSCRPPTAWSGACHCVSHFAVSVAEGGVVFLSLFLSPGL